MDINNSFPGGSRTRVNKVGDRIRQGTATAEDLDVIEQWRSAHRAVLNTFQAILRNKTKYQKITVAQRHKRKLTIFDKLLRLPSMKLSRMDDVAGCRLIFENIESLYKFRSKFLKSNFHHKLKNDVGIEEYMMFTVMM